jgi:WS/DGAT/MGAT family acyltransferase
VLDLAEPDVMAAFDPARPLWQLTLVEGLESGRAAFLLRFHHTISDGVGAIGLAERLFSSSRHGPPARPTTSSEPVGHRSRPGVADVLGMVRLGPVGLAREGFRTARSVARMLAPATRPLSPILVGRGLDRRLHTLEVPLAALQHAAHAVDGTVNDVFLAAVAGGLHAYHDACGAPVDAVRVTMPISVRRPGDRPGGNRFAPVRFVLPIGGPDAAHRAEAAASIVRCWRAEPAVGLTSALASLLNRLPGPVVQRAFAGMLRSVDVDAVDVPGLSGDAYLAGALVERLWAFAPPSGAAMSITLLSHADLACVGIACDRAAVEDPELLASCIEHGFDEVLGLAEEAVVSGVPS